MAEKQNNAALPALRYLWELKIAAQSVTEMYVSVSLLGGHYVKVSVKDFLETLNDMQSFGDTHPHPKRFHFTLENGVLWLHSSMMGRKK